MASIQLSAISGTSLEEIINAIERQRKDIEFIMANLDDDNIKEVSGEKVVNLTIDQAQIKNLLVDTANIKDLAVSNAKIANASITSAKIEDAAITNAKIDRASINKLVVVTADIQDAAITTAKIGDAQITTAKIQQAQIIGAHIADAQILTAHIKDAQITSAKIASAAIDTANIKDASITTAKIGTAQITTGLIKDAAITEALIADLAVSDAKIVSLTANKLTAGTIDASKVNVTNLVADNIVTGTITIASANLLENTKFVTDTSKWSLGGGVSRDTTVLCEGVISIKTEVSGNTSDVWRGYSQSVFCSPGEKIVGSVYTMTDDITTIDRGVKLEVLFYNASNGRIATYASTITPTENNIWKRHINGPCTAPAGSVRAQIFVWVQRNGRAWFAKPMLQKGSLATEWQPHTNELLADKGITNLQIGDSAVDNRVITANTITGDKLVVDAITTREIKAGSITAASGIIADATIGTAKIIDGAITTAKIGDAQITNAKIASLDAGKITTGYLDAARVKIGAATTFDAGYNPLITPVSGGKVFNNVASISVGTAAQTGALVIETPITFGSYMCQIALKGYLYNSTTGTELDLTLDFYAYSSKTFHNHGYKSIGSRNVSKVRIANYNDKVAIIIGDTTDSWDYPNITIPSAKISFTLPPDSFKDGWVMKLVTDLTPYQTTLTTLVGRDLDSSHDLTTGWLYPGTTYIDGGDIYTNSITANQIASKTITANEINVSSLSALSANLGTITAGSITGVTLTSASGSNSITLSGATFTSKVNNRDQVKIVGSDIYLYDDGVNDPTPNYDLIASFGSGYTVQNGEDRGFAIRNNANHFSIGKLISGVNERHYHTDYTKRETIIGGAPEDAEGTGNLSLRSAYYSTNRKNEVPKIQIINSGNYAGIYNYFGRDNDTGSDATDYFFFDVRKYNGTNNGASTSVFTVDKDGATLPGSVNAAGQPYFRAGSGTDVSIAPNAWAKAPHGSVSKNIGGGSYSANDYIVPVAGHYLVVGVVSLSGGTGVSLYLSAFINGVHYDDNRMAQKQAAGNYDGILTGSTIMTCNAGDRISMHVYHTNASNSTLSYYYQSIYKLP